MTEKTALQKIGYFNELIGNGHNMADGDQIYAQFEMIREEFEELRLGVEAYLKAQFKFQMEASEANGEAMRAARNEVRDGIADVIVTVGGLAHRMGVDADADLEMVYQSNMSKFVGSLEVAKVEAGQIFANNDVTANIFETAPGIYALTSSRHQTGKDGKIYPTGKLLKPSSFKNPEFK